MECSSEPDALVDLFYPDFNGQRFQKLNSKEKLDFLFPQESKDSAIKPAAHMYDPVPSLSALGI